MPSSNFAMRNHFFMKIKSFFLGSLFLTLAIAPITPFEKKEDGFVKSLKILNVHETQGPKTLLA